MDLSNCLCCVLFTHTPTPPPPTAFALVQCAVQGVWEN